MRDLELTDRRYKATSPSRLKGTPTLITFWAPRCAPCLEELAALDELQEGLDRGCRYRGAGQKREGSRLHSGSPAVQISILHGSNMERDVSPLGSFFSVVGMAVTALIDGQGKIIDRWSGFDGEENLRKKLTKLMKR